MRKLNVLVLFLFLSCSGLYAQTIPLQQNVLYLSDSLLNQTATVDILSPKLKYKAGDNVNWANPQYSDSAWKTFQLDDINEAGWFRFFIERDSSLRNTHIGISGYNYGKIEIYLDGYLICSSLSRNPLSLPRLIPGKHLIAVRLLFSKNNNEIENNFLIQFSDFNKSIGNLQQQKNEQMIFVSLPLAFALLHFILFIFLPSARGNLYYTLFLIFQAIATYADVESSRLADYSETYNYLIIHRFFIPLASITLLLFIYEIFYEKIPRQFWIYLIAFLIVQVLILLEPNSNFHYFVKLGILQQIEIFRVISVALYKKKQGALIFAIGMLSVVFFGAYDTFLDLELMNPINGITNAYYFGFFGLFIATTIFLSRDFARSNQKIIEQQNHAKTLELEKQLLQAEDKRKSKELEDARRLQLSMLPQCLNNFPGLDVCFSQIPATEVGGDYYDFYADENNVLTIVIGDATGHGMKAGMMVSIIKSLFVADIKDCELVPFMNKAANAIKQMKLGQIYMALQLLRINKNKVQISSAGMSPVFIFRKKTNDVEEIILKAMPLGGPVSNPYKKIETEVHPGDVILMLTDGLPELFNPKKETPDYPAVISRFKEAVHKTADEIVTDLMNFGQEWRQDYPQQDDITTVVIKIEN